jgi:uncharacterized SAM-binding protein YcdF (DUF218 family)
MVSRSRAWMALLAMLVAAGAMVLVWEEHASILRSAALKWAVSDALTAADAIVVLGGGTERNFAAAELYRRGLASRILVDFDENQKFLSGLGVPPQAIETFGGGLRNTYEEACALAGWARKNAARRIIVPTELFSTRRAKWIIAARLRESGTKAELDPISVSAYSAENWWLTIPGRDQFLREITKYAYYRFRYAFAHC